MSSTCCQPLLKRSSPRNRLVSQQIRDHLPHLPRSILHSHHSSLNPHITSPTPRRTQNRSTLPPTSSVTSYSYPPYAQDSAPKYIISPKSLHSLTTQNMSAIISTLYLVASVVIGTLLGVLSLGFVAIMISGPEFEGVRAALRRRGVVLIWEVVRAAEWW